MDESVFVDSVQVGDYQVSYESVMVEDSRCIFRTPHNEIIIRRTEDKKSSTRTLVYQLLGKIGDKNGIFAFIRCSPENRNKLTECGTITAVRWGRWHKGSLLGDFPHSVGIYISTGTSRLCTKVSSKKSSTGDEGSSYENSDKIQMVGVQEDNMGTYLACCIVNEIKRADMFREKVIDDPDLFDDACDWIIDNLSGETMYVDDMNVRDYTNSYVTLISTKAVIPLKWNILVHMDVPEDILDFVSELFLSCRCIEYLHTFIEITHIMRKSVSLCTNNLEVYDYGKAMVNVNFEIGTTINQRRLYYYLKKQRYNVSYFNDINKYIQVTMRDVPDETDGTIRRESGFENTFQIYSTGTIRHSGTGGMSVKRNYYNLMLSIVQFFVQNGREKKFLLLCDEDDSSESESD